MAMGTDIDLSIYAEDGTTNWYRWEVARLGEDRVREMYNALYKRAADMPVGTAIDIMELCKDQKNLRLAVKICCEIIDTYRKCKRFYFAFVDNTYRIFKKYRV